MVEKQCPQAESSAEKLDESTQPLTDEVLASAGLQKITAYVKTEQSSNAKRKQRAREKAEQLGIKQLNIQLPVHMYGLVKEIVQELQSTPDAKLALQNILAKTGAYEPVSMPQPKQLRGWRLRIAKLLGLI